jgi:hypothetical protein
MNDMVLQVKINPVGIDEETPTRFDIFVEGVPGSVCGNAKTLTQAESWQGGIQLAINEQHRLTKIYTEKQYGFDKDKAS